MKSDRRNWMTKSLSVTLKGDANGATMAWCLLGLRVNRPTSPSNPPSWVPLPTVQVPERSKIISTAQKKGKKNMSTLIFVAIKYSVPTSFPIRIIIERVGKVSLARRGHQEALGNHYVTLRNKYCGIKATMRTYADKKKHSLPSHCLKHHRQQMRNTTQHKGRAT